MFTHTPFSTTNWNKTSFRVQLARIRQVLLLLVFLASLVGMNPIPVRADSPAGTLEDFETGFAGSNVGAHADWYDGGAGPAAIAGNGVAGSVGLALDNDIFTWTAHPFQWSDASLTGVLIGMDFQTNGTGGFDDDRVGWMISDSSTNSNDIFGVQLDPGGSGQNIEAYWDGDSFGDDGGRTSIVSLPALSNNAWYRLRAEFTKLTATSARIDVTLTALDGEGNPGTEVASGSILDTNLLPNTAENEIPNAGYFTAATLWPGFKNHNGTAGNVDNAYFEILTGTPPEQYALSVTDDGNGSVTLDPASGTYDENTVVTLTPVPNAGYAFDSWSGTNSGDLSDNGNGTWSITMSGNKAVTATFAELPPGTLVCESFDTYTPGSIIGTYAGWYDGGNGPVVTAGNGVAGSVGLAAGNNIFTWTAHPFDWNAAGFQGVNLQADFKTDVSGHLDDDRIGWMITDSTADSSNIFGVQLDPGGTGYNIEGYWETSTGDARPVIADLPTLGNNTWYRLRLDVTKLTATSASLAASLTELDASGNPVGEVASGSITDTSTLGSDAPHNKYFNAATIWPAFKNYTTAGAPADNTCYEVVTGTPPPQYTLTVSNDGNGDVTLNPIGGTYDEDTVVTLTPVGNSGYGFESWSGPDVGDLSSNGNGTWSITMTENKEVTANFAELPPPPAGICEDFESGFTLGQVVGSHAEWFDGGSGPVVTSGNGLLNSIGLAPASAIFTWTEHPFDWNNPAFQSITFNMDYQTNASGYFDDDRMGWMTTDSDASSTYFFGVQLDTVSGGDGGIVTYWRDDTDTRIQTPIVALGALTANTWYRLEATITKLTDTSARIDVSLVQLDGSGNPTGTPYTGTVDDTSTWDDGAPDESYFTASNMWPAYKNYSAITGAADNVCFDIESGRFAFLVSTDWHTSDADTNTDIMAKVAQIANWVDSPTAAMPAPEFMVITGDFPRLSQTESIIDTEIDPDFLWYPVMGNHEVSDSPTQFPLVRDTKVPTLPYIDDYGPAGSVNSTYSWSYQNAHFVALNGYWNGNTTTGSDTAADGDVVPALNTWLGNDLATNGQTHNFAFIHEPAYPAHRHVGDSLDAHTDNRNDFIATLNTYGVESLFAGHTHYYEHDVAPEFPLGNLHQVTNGSLRSGGVPVTVTYVLVEGNSTTYKVYSWTGSTFTLYDQWTVGGGIPSTPPAAPTALNATPVSYAHIDLAWTDNADNETALRLSAP
jgi:hypothetical protein